MTETQMLWVDPVRCTGCGLCIDVCPTEAIALVEGKARIDEETCVGCGACADECLQEAIHPVIQGELIPAPERPAPTVYRPSPLVETASAAVTVVGAGLLMKAAGALVRALSRWLMRRPVATKASAGTPSQAVGGTGRGRRARHRRRGL